MTAGVVCDDYKVKDYEEKLKEAGFTWEKRPNTPMKEVTTLKVQYGSAEALRLIKEICEKLELKFAARRAKN